MAVDEALDGVAAQHRTARTRKERIRWLALPLAKPCRQRGGGFRGERSASLFSTFAFAAQMCACPQDDVAAS